MHRYRCADLIVIIFVSSSPPVLQSHIYACMRIYVRERWNLAGYYYYSNLTIQYNLHSPTNHYTSQIISLCAVMCYFTCTYSSSSSPICNNEMSRISHIQQPSLCEKNNEYVCICICWSLHRHPLFAVLFFWFEILRNL